MCMNRPQKLDQKSNDWRPAFCYVLRGGLCGEQCGE